MKVSAFYEYTYYRAYDLIKLTGNYDLSWSAAHYLAFFYSLFAINFAHIAFDIRGMLITV